MVGITSDKEERMDLEWLKEVFNSFTEWAPWAPRCLIVLIVVFLVFVVYVKVTDDKWYREHPEGLPNNDESEQPHDSTKIPTD